MSQTPWYKPWLIQSGILNLNTKQINNDLRANLRIEFND